MKLCILSPRSGAWQNVPRSQRLAPWATFSRPHGLARWEQADGRLLPGVLILKAALLLFFELGLNVFEGFFELPGALCLRIQVRF